MTHGKTKKKALTPLRPPENGKCQAPLPFIANKTKLKKKIGKDFGSGYSSDPVTCKFLEEHAETHKDSGIFRKTWATWKNLYKNKGQKKLEF